MTLAALYAFLLVFARCSALLLASPLFGAQTTPVQVRVLTTLAVSAAISVVVGPHVGPLPADMYGLAVAVFHEVLAGLLMGAFITFALQAAQMAGELLDLSSGLMSSSILNPVDGVSESVLSQYKSMLALVIFLSVDGHHVLLANLAQSYSAMPLSMASLPAIQVGLVTLIEQVCLLAFQIAAPVFAVGLVVDAGFGLVNRAVPQMPVMLVGIPAKTAVGLMTLAIALPSMANGVLSAISLGERYAAQLIR